MGELERRSVEEMKRRLPAEVHRHIRRFILFGSRVRGSAAEDSDLDLVALVDEKTPELEKALDDVAYSVMWDYDFWPAISLKVFSQDRFDSAVAKGYSFYRKVMREGVVV